MEELLKFNQLGQWTLEKSDKKKKIEDNIKKLNPSDKEPKIVHADADEDHIPVDLNKLKGTYVGSTKKGRTLHYLGHLDWDGPSNLSSHSYRMDNGRDGYTYAHYFTAGKGFKGSIGGNFMVDKGEKDSEFKPMISKHVSTKLNN